MIRPSTVSSTCLLHASPPLCTCLAGKKGSSPDALAAAEARLGVLTEEQRLMATYQPGGKQHSFGPNGDEFLPLAGR